MKKILCYFCIVVTMLLAIIAVTGCSEESSDIGQDTTATTYRQGTDTEQGTTRQSQQNNTESEQTGANVQQQSPQSLVGRWRFTDMIVDISDATSDELHYIRAEIIEEIAGWGDTFFMVFNPDNTAYMVMAEMWMMENVLWAVENSLSFVDDFFDGEEMEFRWGNGEIIIVDYDGEHRINYKLSGTRLYLPLADDTIYVFERSVAPVERTLTTDDITGMWFLETIYEPHLPPFVADTGLASYFEFFSDNTGIFVEGYLFEREIIDFTWEVNNNRFVLNGIWGEEHAIDVRLFNSRLILFGFDAIDSIIVLRQFGTVEDDIIVTNQPDMTEPITTPVGRWRLVDIELDWEFIEIGIALGYFGENLTQTEINEVVAWHNNHIDRMLEEANATLMFFSDGYGYGFEHAPRTVGDGFTWTAGGRMIFFDGEDLGRFSFSNGRLILNSQIGFLQIFERIE